MLFIGSQRQRGLTLVEVMIALALSSIILAGLFSLFLTAKRNQDIGNHLNQIGEDARFFTEFIARDLRMAGQEAGCALSEPKLAWDGEGGSGNLTIRYCHNKKPKNVVYNFNENGQVNYNSENNSDPLINGVYLNNIYFGTRTRKEFKYLPQEPKDFDDVKTVTLDFELRGETNTGQDHSDKVIPEFQVTVAIRNNLFPNEPDKSN